MTRKKRTLEGIERRATQGLKCYNKVVTIVANKRY